MAIQWYYGRGADITGPVSSQDLSDLAAGGQPLPTDTVWKDDIEMGVPAGNVEGLFPPTAPAVPEAFSSPADAVEAVPRDSPGGAPRLDLPASDAELIPPEEPAAAPSQPPPARKARAVAGKGVVIIGQDGTNVKYRMKCTTCGHEDSSWKTMRISRGTTRSSFYCPKCRKRRDAEIYGTI